MRLTKKERSEIRKHLRGLNLTEEAQLMKRFIQHGRISTYEHVLSVTRFSFYLNRRLHLGASPFWHISDSHERLHGFHHPSVALKNAMRLYTLSPVEQNIIQSHMWPLTLFSLPKCRAAVIVCLADKICSTYETLVRSNPFPC